MKPASSAERTLRPKGRTSLVRQRGVVGGARLQPSRTAGQQPTRPQPHPTGPAVSGQGREASDSAGTAGSSHPLGATLTPAGANFSLFSRAASRVELLFFDRADDARPSRSLALDPARHRTYHYWHAFIPGVKPGRLYGYLFHGPATPPPGLRFDPTKVLLDPYARGIVLPSGNDRQAASAPGDNAAAAMKGVVTDLAAYDWEDDTPLRNPSSRTIVY